jgi:hypothetical protein
MLIWTAHHVMQVSDRFRHHRHCHSTITIRDTLATRRKGFACLQAINQETPEKIPPTSHSRSLGNDLVDVARINVLFGKWRQRRSPSHRW